MTPGADSTKMLRQESAWKMVVFACLSSDSSMVKTFPPDVEDLDDIHLPPEVIQISIFPPPM